MLKCVILMCQTTGSLADVMVLTIKWDDLFL